MSMLTLTNVGQSFGDFDVFTGINASIPNDAKIGLVGPNGIGKTTLLRVLAGLDSSSTGTVTVAQGTRIGYLRQEAMEAFAERENTIHAEMLTVFAALREQEATLRELEHRMADGDHSDAMLAEYSAAQHEFELAGGYEYELRISQVLQGLGFGKEDWDMPLAQLSGGQKTRALLARLLLEAPDLLILDEPTNHLDVEAIEWLEGRSSYGPARCGGQPRPLFPGQGGGPYLGDEPGRDRVVSRQLQRLCVERKALAAPRYEYEMRIASGVAGAWL